MAKLLGAHADRVSLVRDLLALKGRKAQGLYAFEGATLLDEAVRSGTEIVEIYATESVYGGNPLVRQLEAQGTPVFLVDDRTARRISDLETPTGLICTTPLALTPLNRIFSESPLILALADLNDPGNAGTLLRSAEAFGARAIVFGRLGVDPHHPKVVRGAMGAIFRLKLAVADPKEFSAASSAAGVPAFGLCAGGGAIDGREFPARCAIVVGHERRGLGLWEAACERLVAIPMAGPTESLNAAVAGSIALYEASRRNR
jgi:TrmH family RNA methyltransferase